MRLLCLVKNVYIGPLVSWIAWHGMRRRPSSSQGGSSHVAFNNICDDSAASVY
jgi:hypothetical protein